MVAWQFNPRPRSESFFNICDLIFVVLPILFQCSVTCGSGFKQRKIECVSGVDALCDERTKPLATGKCDLGRCPRWHTGRWTGVSYLPRYNELLYNEVLGITNNILCHSNTNLTMEKNLHISKKRTYFASPLFLSYIEVLLRCLR